MESETNDNDEAGLDRSETYKICATITSPDDYNEPESEINHEFDTKYDVEIPGIPVPSSPPDWDELDILEIKAAVMSIRKRKEKQADARRSRRFRIRLEKEKHICCEKPRTKPVLHSFGVNNIIKECDVFDKRLEVKLRIFEVANLFWKELQYSRHDSDFLGERGRFHHFRKARGSLHDEAMQAMFSCW